MIMRTVLAFMLLAALILTAGCAIVYKDTYRNKDEIVTETGLFGFPSDARDTSRGLLPLWRTTQLSGEESPVINEQ